MCGIVGAVSMELPGIDIGSAKRMADKISHRGPDDAGYLFFHTGVRHNKNISFYLNLTDDRFRSLDDFLPSIESSSAYKELNQHDYDCYFGHRRLSILDVTHFGRQPMSDLSKNIWVTYNGEIYNFKELMAELYGLGHRFKTNTDTEVIIYAYIEWGIECLNKFNGMFSFAIYDNFQKKIYLVRDRYGIKPLYYGFSQNNTLVFASEIKAILEYKDFKTQIDKSALIEYFTFQNIFTDRTLNNNIKMLPAGHYMEIDLRGGVKSIVSRQYWDFNFYEPLSIKDEREYIEEFDRLFEQAVHRQLVSDVEVGSYLSGGMDSGAIVSVASRYVDNLKTFTIGFDLTSASGLELGYDERQKSERMSYLFKTEHYEMVLKSGDMERCLPTFAYHIEEPRVGQSYPNYYAAKLASKFVKVVLSGAGGDELLAGYPWRYFSAANSMDFNHYIDKYYNFWQRLAPDVSYKQLFSPIIGDIGDVDPRKIFADVFGNVDMECKSDEDYINRSLYFEAKTFLHGLLTVEDKLSMSHGLETRVPFLDNDLVDFAQKIPLRLKLDNLKDIKRMNENEIGKFHQTSSGKKILRQSASKYMPSDIYNGAKQGFTPPGDGWFKGESIEFIKKRLLSDSASMYKYLDKELTQKMIKEHLEGKHNRRLLIWGLISFEEWCNIYDR